ncbi:hypothetical protein GCM10029976_021040 [Kribbella albertanoniae]
MVGRAADPWGELDEDFAGDDPGSTRRPSTGIRRSTGADYLAAAQAFAGGDEAGGDGAAPSVDGSAGSFDPWGDDAPVLSPKPKRRVRVDAADVWGPEVAEPAVVSKAEVDVAAPEAAVAPEVPLVRRGRADAAAQPVRDAVVDVWGADQPAGPETAPDAPAVESSASADPVSPPEVAPRSRRSAARSATPKAKASAEAAPPMPDGEAESVEPERRSWLTARQSGDDAEAGGPAKASRGGRGWGGAGRADGGAGSGERSKKRGLASRGPIGSGRRRRDAADELGESAVADGSDPAQVARTILLDKLSGQPRTRAELADVLAERGIADEVADEVLDRFTEVGLIDDAAFATAWVESRHRGRGLGKRALAQELRRRGVDDELSRDALEELEPEQEEETARALVRKKLRSMRSLDRQVAMRRLLGMLARKGYSGGMAMSIIKQELDASHEEFPLLDSSGIEVE